MLVALSEFVARRVWYAWALRVAICWTGIIFIGPLTVAAAFRFFPIDDPDALREVFGWFRAAIAISTVVSMVLIYYFVRICFRYLDQRDPSELRMDINARTPIWLVSGCIAAICMLAIVFLIQLSLGWIQVKSFSDPFSAVFLGTAFTNFIQFASVGVGEEIRYRAYGYASGEGSVPFPVLIVANALVFGLLHAQYDQFGFVALLNLMMIAGFYIASLHLFNSIWFGVGFHFIWDFAQVSVFGLAFSGNKDASLIVIDQTGPPLWVGGTALIEAGLLYMLVFAAVSACMVYLLNRNGTGLTGFLSR